MLGNERNERDERDEDQRNYNLEAGFKEPNSGKAKWIAALVLLGGIAFGGNQLYKSRFEGGLEKGKAQMESAVICENHVASPSESITTALEGLRKYSIGTYFFQPPKVETSREEFADLLLRSEPLSIVTETEYILRMWGYHYTGDLEKSLNEANYALNLNPDNRKTLGCKIYLLTELGRGPEAIPSFDRYLTLQKP